MNIIKKCRLSAELTQEEFATLLGVSQNTVCAWETTDQVPHGLPLLKLSYIFSMDPEVFLSPVGRMQLDEFRMSHIPFVIAL